MADKKLKLKKNNKSKKSYDNKLITWISVGLGAFVAIVVAIVLIITLTTGYVAKVDGLKIYDYEYRYFLQNAMYKLQDEEYKEPDNFDEMTDEEKDAAYKAFWTDERKAEAAKNALEDARQFKAQYRLAVAAGHKLSSEEKTNLKSNITSYYNQYMSYGYSEEMVEAYFLGGMKLSDYKDYAIMQSTIEKYKEDLKKDMSPKDEELKAIYDEKPDDYRTIGIRQFQIDVGVEKPTDDKASDYQTKLDKYNEAYKKALDAAKEVMDAYNSGKTMNTYKKDKDGNYILNDKGEKTVDRENLSFIDYIKAESDDPNSSKEGGLSQINNVSPSTIEEITDYALSMIWNEDRTQIIKKEADKEEDKNTETDKEVKDEPQAQDAETDKEADKTDEKKDVMTKLEIIETQTAIFVVRAESITDYENSTESEKGAADSIKDRIKAEWLEDKAVEKLKAMVNEKGDAYKVESKKEEDIKAINDSIFSKL